MAYAVDADKTNIWDEAEVFILTIADVTDIETLFPTVGTVVLPAAWEAGFVGLIDPGKGIPVEPSVEIKHYDGYGNARYRSKSSKGTVSTGFTCYEDNAVTKTIVLPGSKAGRMGAPKNLRRYTAYRTVDEGKVKIMISLRPALLELTSHSGAVEGEQEAYEFTVHHANDPSNDVFATFEGMEVVTP